MPSNNAPILTDRRLLLRLLVKVLLWVSLLIAAWVLFSPLFKNSKPVNVGVVETVFDISEMQPGDIDIVEWFSKPLIIAYRTVEIENQLLSSDANVVRDVDGAHSNQPAFADNRLRSETPGWFVSLGLGTGSGCALKFSTASTEPVEGHPWAGGFVDHCDGSRFDLAGRVLVNQSAKKNTTIPVWRLETGRLIVSTERPQK